MRDVTTGDMMFRLHHGQVVFLVFFFLSFPPFSLLFRPSFSPCCWFSSSPLGIFDLNSPLSPLSSLLSSQVPNHLPDSSNMCFLSRIYTAHSRTSPSPLHMKTTRYHHNSAAAPNEASNHASPQSLFVRAEMDLNLRQTPTDPTVLPRPRSARTGICTPEMSLG